MSSINLYEIYNLENMEGRMVELEQTLRKVYDKNKEKELLRCKEEYEAGFKRVGKMSLSLMLFKELNYFNVNKYIKSYINRKLYANKAERKLDFDRDFD